MKKTPEKQAKQTKPDGRWQKGQSGNPKGRPAKEKCLSFYLRDYMGKKASSIKILGQFAVTLGMDPDKVTVGEVIATNMFVQALGDASVLRELFNRLEGKVPDKIQATIHPMSDYTRDELTRIANGFGGRAVIGDAGVSPSSDN